MRKRILTENIGCYLSLEDYAMVKAEAQARQCSVSDYLRQAAVQPLRQAQFAEAEVDREQD